MEVSKLNYNTPVFKGKSVNFQKKVANSFAKIDGIGEGASIAFDFLGKAAVVPAVIMLSSKEPKEKKEYSAFKNPVAAVIQLALEVPILFFGGIGIEKAANKGVFDTKDSTRYNEKLHKDIFIKELKNSVQEENDDIKNIIDTLDKKGLSRKMKENIEDFIKTTPNDSKDVLNKAFSEYKNAHTNLYHLKNRLCFVAAIILTPIICALENKLHPIIMDKIYEEEHRIEAKKHPKPKLLNLISIEQFKLNLQSLQRTENLNKGAAK